MGQHSPPLLTKKVMAATRHHLQPSVRQGLLPPRPVAMARLGVGRPEQQQRLGSHTREICVRAVVRERCRDEYETWKVGVLRRECNRIEAPAGPADHAEGVVSELLDQSDISPPSFLRIRIEERPGTGQAQHNGVPVTHAGSVALAACVEVERAGTEGDSLSP